MDRDQAAIEFVKMIISVGVTGSLDEIEGLLVQPLGIHKQKWKEVGEWIQTLGAEEQQNIRFLLKEAILSSLYSILVNLDGGDSYMNLKTLPAEAELRLRYYPNIETAKLRGVHDAIVIAPTEKGEDLHDIFSNLLEQQGIL